MCNVVGSVDEHGNASIICQKSQLPIVISNEFGMYCVKECDKQLDIEAKDKLQNLLEGLDQLFGRNIP